jgi:DNA-binding transcriptional ArsR family regulator
MRTLAERPLTTAQIAERMPDTPKSSIYRHLKLLLEGEAIALADTRLINGIQEKVYQLAKAPYLTAADLQDATADDHLQYFTDYTVSLLSGFAHYLQTAVSPANNIDFVADNVGYTEATFYANDAEMFAMQTALNKALLPLFANDGEENGRRKRKIAIIIHPEEGTGIGDQGSADTPSDPRSPIPDPQ